ncbi:MAG: hypothetical protein EOP48_12380, partial [Sphingobacteriales bacterium]
EYVEGMWQMLQADSADDFVLATNKTTTVRDFLKMSFQYAGLPITFEGEGINEIAICSSTGRTLVKIDPAYFRPTEVELLVGDASKAKKLLNWQAKTSVDELCREMTYADLYRTEQEIQQKREVYGIHAETLAHDKDGFLKWFKENHLSESRV